MTPEAAGDDLGPVAGLAWNPEGMLGLSGPLADLLDRLDAAFVAIAAAFQAETHHYAPLLAVRDLRRIKYFSSFPHLVTLPIKLNTDARDIEAFRESNADLGTGPLVVGRTAPIDSALAPAACYAVYAALAGTCLDMPRHVTTCGTCFRQETHYQPLRRQWSFRMREIVHLGDAASAKAFLERARAEVAALAERWNVPLSIEEAGDPFFDPGDVRKLHQQLFPNKHEMVFEGRLALGSLNAHRNFFGEAFDLELAGSPVHSACVAFGLERWIYAILRRHGTDPAAWPR